jgi:hypothetical protein
MTADRLFDLPPTTRLTDRQAHALEKITDAGYDGLHTDELGAIVHAFTGKHPADQLCEWCGSAGLEVGKALRGKALVQQRRRKSVGGDAVMVWTIAGKLNPPRAVPDPDTDIWPEGF